MNDRQIAFLTTRDGQQTEHHRFAPGFDDASQRLRHRPGFVQRQNDRPASLRLSSFEFVLKQPPLCQFEVEEVFKIRVAEEGHSPGNK